MKEPDPENLRMEERPAVIDVSGQGAVFVALAKTKDNGWLRVREWDGTSAKLPAHRVNAVRYLEIEAVDDPDGDRGKLKRIASEKWRAEAMDRDTDADGQQPVVSDD